jgi:hypothetical protein
VDFHETSTPTIPKQTVCVLCASRGEDIVVYLYLKRKQIFGFQQEAFFFIFFFFFFFFLNKYFYKIKLKNLPIIIALPFGSKARY